MNALPHFQVFEDYAEYRPVGQVTLPEIVQMITAAIDHAREQEQRNLLVDITGVTGFRSPSLAERYFFVEQWARAARAYVRLAFVAPPSLIDERKFGVSVAANHNQTANIFTTSTEARAWLSGLP
jgi:hypothetical protein